LHLGTSLLVWIVLGELSIPGAFLAALLFAVHPVNVESVAWISQRKTIMAGLFALLSIYWYLKADRPAAPHEARLIRYGAWPWYALSLAAFVLGMLSKASIATLPFILLLIVWWRRGRLTRGDLVRMAPFVMIAIPLVAVNMWFRGHGGTVGRSADCFQRLAGAGAVPWFYLYKALVPVKLIFFYPQWDIQTDRLRWWLPLTAALVVTTALWWSRRTTWGKNLLFGWGFFWLALVPVLGLADAPYMSWSLVADHYQYVAIIAVLAMLAAGWSGWRARLAPKVRSVALIMPALIVSISMLLTSRQCYMYRDQETLYRTVIRDNPDSWMALCNLGGMLVDANRSQEAVPLLRRALELIPNFADAENNLGLALFNLGQPQQAISCFERALEIKPDYALAHNSWGYVLLQTDRQQDALDHFRQALAMQPYFADAENNIGLALLKLQRTPEAVGHFEQAIRIRPDFVEAHNNMAMVRVNAGQLQDALANLQKAQQLKPDSAEICANLASIHAQMHNTADATALAKKAIELAKAQGQSEVTQRMETLLESLRVGPASALPPTDP
jgi:tetratricopeptide (TPR) repeat protein